MNIVADPKVRGSLEGEIVYNKPLDTKNTKIVEDGKNTGIPLREDRFRHTIYSPDGKLVFQAEPQASKVSQASQASQVSQGSPEPPEPLESQRSEESEEKAFEKPEQTRAKSQSQSQSQAKKKIRRIVFIDMKIKRLSDLNTSEEHFRVKYHYYLTWLATESEYKDFKKHSKSQSEQKLTRRQSNAKPKLPDVQEWVPSWTPYVEYVNAVEVLHHNQISNFKMKKGDHESFNVPPIMPISPNSKGDGKGSKYSWAITEEELGFDPTKGHWIRVQYEVDALFAEELELENFPFDCQDFTMVFKLSQSSHEEADLLPFPRTGEFLTLDSQYSVVDEWVLENLITEFDFTSPDHSRAKRRYPIMSIRIKASRVWRSYLTTFAITLCMFALGLGTFALPLDPEELGNRLNYCVVFLLADVGTLQLVFEKLPKIQYTTILEEYTFCCFFFLFSTTIWSCFAGAFNSLSDHDPIAFFTFLVIFVCLQVFFIVRAIYSRTWEMQKIDADSTNLEKFISRKLCCYAFCSRTGDKKIIVAEWRSESLRGDAKEKTELIVKGEIQKKKTQSNLKQTDKLGIEN